MKSTLSISSLSRQVLLRETRDYLMIALGMILYGIGWTVFLLPNDITTGGVPGIASIVFWATAEVVSVSLSPRTVVRVERILLPLSSINTGI